MGYNTFMGDELSQSTEDYIMRRFTTNTVRQVPVAWIVSAGGSATTTDLLITWVKGLAEEFVAERGGESGALWISVAQSWPENDLANHPFAGLCGSVK